MAAEIERRTLDGRVFTNGVAQETVRDDDGAVAGVRLTCMPGHPSFSAAASCGPVSIPLPEPVTAEAGRTITISVEWLEDGGCQESSPMFIRHPTTVTSAVMLTSPSAPGQPSPGAAAG